MTRLRKALIRNYCAPAGCPLMPGSRSLPSSGYCRAFGRGKPAALVSDPYRSAELHQAVQGRVRIIERARSGGEATSNVQALRSLLLDKPSGVTEPSRDLLAAAFRNRSGYRFCRINKGQEARRQTKPRRCQCRAIARGGRAGEASCPGRFARSGD